MQDYSDHGNQKPTYCGGTIPRAGLQDYKKRERGQPEAVIISASCTASCLKSLWPGLPTMVDCILKLCTTITFPSKCSCRVFQCSSEEGKTFTN